MLDSKAIEEMIRSQIAAAVDQQVEAIVTQPQWINDLETRIIKHVQDRITARFANIGDIPELKSSIQESVAKIIDQGNLPDLSSYVDVDRVQQIADQNLQELIQRAMEDLVLDPGWINKIETSVKQGYHQKFADHVSRMDIDSVVVQQIDRVAEKWQDRWRPQGIADVSTQPMLFIYDDQVTVDTKIVVMDLLVQKDAKISGSVTVENLVVTGTINTDNVSWNEISDQAANKALEKLTAQWRDDLVQQTLDLARNSGIEFQQILLDGAPLIHDGSLNKHITRSNLQTLGALQTLTVLGDASINDTLNVNARRVGINTGDPEMALTVWDEEVSLLMGKHSKDTAYIGTGRRQSLTIGVNRKAGIDIDHDGLVTIGQLRLDKWRVGFETQVPGYSGTRGDIVFNSDPRPGTPWAWQCLGGFRWNTITLPQ